MKTRFDCTEFAFIRFEGLSGFNAFKNNASVGIDEVCSRFDQLKQENEMLKYKLCEIGTLLEENLSLLREDQTIFHLTKEVLDKCKSSIQTTGSEK